MNTQHFNSGKIEYSRRFLLENLPEPLTRASAHLQFFDNFLTATRLFLRQIRTPQTKTWERFFIQKYPLTDNDNSAQIITEIQLSEYEYKVLEIFEANELRYNRYFYEYEGKNLAVDLHLGDLWGLIVCTAFFESEEETQNFNLPNFAFLEITNNKMFGGEKLADLKFADVQNELTSSE